MKKRVSQTAREYRLVPCDPATQEREDHTVGRRPSTIWDTEKKRLQIYLSLFDLQAVRSWFVRRCHMRVSSAAPLSAWGWVCWCRLFFFNKLINDSQREKITVGSRSPIVGTFVFAKWNVATERICAFYMCWKIPLRCSHATQSVALILTCCCG